MSVKIERRTETVEMEDLVMLWDESFTDDEGNREHEGEEAVVFDRNVDDVDCLVGVNMYAQNGACELNREEVVALRDFLNTVLGE
jgi:hypothetical protein